MLVVFPSIMCPFWPGNGSILGRIGDGKATALKAWSDDIPRDTSTPISTQRAAQEAPPDPGSDVPLRRSFRKGKLSPVVLVFDGVVVTLGEEWKCVVSARGGWVRGHPSTVAITAFPSFSLLSAGRPSNWPNHTLPLQWGFPCRTPSDARTSFSRDHRNGKSGYLRHRSRTGAFRGPVAPGRIVCY